MRKIVIVILFVINLTNAQDKIPFIDYAEIQLQIAESSKKKDHTKTLELINKINKNDSMYFPLLTTKPYYLLQLKRFEEAIKVADEGIKSNYKNSKVFFYINKGVALTNLKKHDLALENYNDGIKKYPKNYVLWFNKAVVLESKGLLNDAIIAYQEAITLNPLNRKPHLQMGTIFYKQNRISQALMCYNIYILLDPNSQGAFTILEKLENSSILLPAGQTNIALYQALPKSCHIAQSRSIVQILKGIKNPTEQEWLRKVMVKDGVAMVHFLKWLEDNIGKTKISELSAATKLHECRAAQDLFVGDSFPAISGYKGNGAIIHYKVSPESDTELHADGIYLIDSGGQYLDGTTDITRTLTLGNVTEDQKNKYTLVLKGHIGLATIVFPEGTRGNQLDILARQALWKNALNYRHGTGHGVGFFMNVHEGPQRIGPGAGGSFDVALQEGMYSSNEPGYYEEGEEGFGIRIENLVITQKDQLTDYGQFFNFETITLCPMDNQLINVEMLTSEERKWYNDYQQEVFEKLSPRLDEAETLWLKEKCQAI